MRMSRRLGIFSQGGIKWIFKNGVVAGITWNGSGTSGTSATSSITDTLYVATSTSSTSAKSARCITDNPISLTNLKTLYFEVTSVSGSSDRRFQVSDDGGATYDAYVNVSSTGTGALNVTALIGSFHVAITSYNAKNAPGGSFRVSQIWGE